jgi:hypothetical protein
MRLLAFSLLLAALAGCTKPAYREADFAVAADNARLANESYVRSLRFVNGWLTCRDSLSGLIPTNLTSKLTVWEPYNAAADNYAFMVLTAWMLDKQLYGGPLFKMLEAEKRLTSRLNSLPDAYSFEKQDFVNDEADTTAIIFHASEYIKDGLIPLAELTGDSPWTDRMLEMMNDFPQYYTVLKNIDQLGPYKAVSEEINGNMLQSLSRLYYMTGKQEYLDRAMVIGDYYLSGERDLSTVPYLRLRDHGCEIIGGLSEFYLTLHFTLPEKKAQYQAQMHKILDRILEVGRNEDHIFFNAVNMQTGEVVDSMVVDNWGYIFNAFYTVYLLDQKEEYRQAVLDGVSTLNEKYRNFAWEGKSHDGYADALESGINLYNREQVPELKSWIDSEMQVMFGMQREDGIIGGWHGDGNFARTAIMYSLWKTGGVHVNPWREDLEIGAEQRNGVLLVYLSAGESWEGNLIFDTQRHKTNLKLPLDYPRINQFPEWFTVKPEHKYSLRDLSGKIRMVVSGEDMAGGIPLSIGKGERMLLVISQKINKNPL